MTNITDFGDLKKIDGLEHEVHSQSNNAKGGMDMVDEDNIISRAMKEVSGKLTMLILKG
jgi:hypothetical protein